MYVIIIHYHIVYVYVHYHLIHTHKYVRICPCKQMLSLLLISTQKLKSTTGLFDLSFPQEYLTFSSEYNSLHDPCLKDYFYREDIQKKLIRNGFVTKDLYVKSSLKEYNEYRRFLENEFMKVRMVYIMYIVHTFVLSVYVCMHSVWGF